MVQPSGDDQLFQIPDGAPAEVREFLDRGSRRASIAEGGRMMIDPGKVLTNLETTMRRVDADINIHVSIAEDIATEAELMVLMGDLMMASPLIVFLVNTGMQIMKAGGYPVELVTKPLPDHYDVTVMVPALTVNERPHQIAKAIFDRRSTSPDDLVVDDVEGDLEPLDLPGKIEVFIILFYMWGTKIGALKNVTGTDR